MRQSASSHKRLYNLQNVPRPSDGRDDGKEWGLGRSYSKRVSRRRRRTDVLARVSLAGTPAKDVGESDVSCLELRVQMERCAFRGNAMQTPNEVIRR